MKTLNKNLWMMGLMLMTLMGLTGCDFDYGYDYDTRVGYNVSGRWFGDLDMYMNNEKARGSDIEFVPKGYGYYSGTGTEIDYYYRGTMTHYFDYEIKDGVIYLYFDDPELNCRIRDYRLSRYEFTGYMDGYDSSVRFRLQNYDIYWDDYGYGGYYYSREQSMASDSLWNDSTQVTRAIPNGTEQPKCYRGVNRKK